MTSIIRGQNFCLSGGVIKFFGDQGWINGPTDWTASFIPPTGGIGRMEPVDSLPSIRQVIEGDIANGQGDNIAMLVVAPLNGVYLFLEGVITPTRLQSATEPDENTVDIKDVVIDDRTLTVRVAKNAAHTIATADARGVLIP